MHLSSSVSQASAHMAAAVTPVTVRVLPDDRGRWSVELTGGAGPVLCETLNDARDTAYRYAARQGPCLLLIQDAYHRVILQQLFGDMPMQEGREGRDAGAP